MERINIPVSIQNTAIVDKLQQREISDPLIHQLSNGELVEEKQNEKMETVTEVDEAEGQTIDPDKKREKGKGKKQRKQRKAQDRKNYGADSGKFVDFSA